MKVRRRREYIRCGKEDICFWELVKKCESRKSESMKRRNHSISVINHGYTDNMRLPATYSMVTSIPDFVHRGENDWFTVCDDKRVFVLCDKTSFVSKQGPAVVLLNGNVGMG